jgi:aryl-alcohol dehydrogenase-like predicted oxidoreductase
MLDNRSVQKYRLVIEDAGGWPAFQHLLKTLGRIANRLQTSIASVAARWVLTQPGVAAVILGVGGGAHIPENQAMLRTAIPNRDLQEIDRVLASLPMLPGDVFGLERDRDGPHAANMKMNLNTEQPR